MEEYDRSNELVEGPTSFIHSSLSVQQLHSKDLGGRELVFQFKSQHRLILIYDILENKWSFWSNEKNDKFPSEATIEAADGLNLGYIVAIASNHCISDEITVSAFNEMEPKEAFKAAQLQIKELNSRTLTDSDSSHLLEVQALTGESIFQKKEDWLL